MQDPRALSSIRNLDTYRAWEREAFKQSGFLIFTVGAPTLGSILVCFFSLFQRNVGQFGMLAFGAVLAAYLLATLGLMALAARRLSVWKKAHP